MATKAKNILSSLYKLGHDLYVLVCQRFTPYPPPCKSLINSVFTPYSDYYNLITAVQPSGCHGCDFSV